MRQRIHIGTILAAMTLLAGALMVWLANPTPLPAPVPPPATASPTLAAPPLTPGQPLIGIWGDGCSYLEATDSYVHLAMPAGTTLGEDSGLIQSPVMLDATYHFNAVGTYRFYGGDAATSTPVYSPGVPTATPEPDTAHYSGRVEGATLWLTLAGPDGHPYFQAPLELTYLRGTPTPPVLLSHCMSVRRAPRPFVP